MTNRMMTVVAMLVLAGTAMGQQQTVAGSGAHACRTPAPNMEPTVLPATDLPPVAVHDGPVVQVALLLDTSNSMDGLIDQAKATLWSIVNELGEARDGEDRLVQLQVALYEYGNNGIPAEVGYIRQRAPFTTDLDVLSEQLFGLRTWGGQEHCGEVMYRAVRELRWWRGADESAAGPGDDCVPVVEKKALKDAVREGVVRGIEGRVDRAKRPALPVFSEVVDGKVIRIVVIAGNEPFTQGSVAYQEAIGDARALGAVVNTIFCGDRGEGEGTGWADGALLGGGVYASIDQNEAVAQPPTPYDTRLSELNSELNTTYIAYGANGARGMVRQLEADEANSDAFIAPRRTAAKARAQYVNSGWDLVDAVEHETVKLEDLTESELPESLRGLSVVAQRERVEELSVERERVRSEILRIAAERDAFLAAHASGEGERRLNDALIWALREQVLAQGLRFENPLD